MTEPSPADRERIEAFQDARSRFQADWNRNFLRFMLPGFLLFAVGIFVSQGMDEGWLRFVPLALGGLLFGTGLVRGGIGLFKGRACPDCGTPQDTQIEFPYRRCPGCGARLSYGVRDSG